MYYLVYYICQACKRRYCFLGTEIKKQDFCPVCFCGSTDLIESSQAEYKAQEEAVKAKIDFEKKEAEREIIYIAGTGSAKPKQIKTQYEVCYCKLCNRHYVITNLETACKGEIKHHIDKLNDTKFSYRVDERLAFETAQKKCDELNKPLIDATEPMPKPIRTLWFDGTNFPLANIRGLHERVYMRWGVQRFFVEKQGIWEYDNDYATFLDEYYYETEIKKLTKEYGYSTTELEKKREEYLDQSRNRRIERLNRINDETHDPKERFYYYMNDCGFLQDVRLFWKISGMVVLFNSINEFVREFVGITNIYRLSAAEKSKIINRYTLKYFFFKEEKDTFDGVFNEDLRLGYLIAKYSNQILGFGSIDEFRNGLRLYDDKVEKREALIAQLKNPVSDWAIADEVLNIIHGNEYAKSYWVQTPLDAIIPDDTVYLPQIRNENFENYLALCCEWSEINSQKKLSVFGLELSLDRDNAEKIIKNIVKEAYFSQYSSSENKGTALRKFAILRLLFKIDMLSISGALNSVINNNKSLLGKIKENICKNTTYGKILRKTYFDCCGEIDKKNIKIVEIDGKAQTLLDILKTAKGTSDGNIASIYEHEAVKNLLEKILYNEDTDSDGYKILLKKTDEITFNLKQSLSKLDDIIDEARANFVPEIINIADECNVKTDTKKDIVTNQNSQKTTNIKGKDKKFTSPV